MSRTWLWIGMVVAAACGGGDGEGVDPALIRVVERGDLVITVRERGEIRAARDTRVSSSLEGRATLIHLIPEGTVVQAGDRVAELDVSAIVEKRAQQAIAVAKAAAALEQAQKTVEIVEKELQAAWRTAETRVQIARLRKEKFLGHERKAAAGATGAGNGTLDVAGADGTEDAEGTSAADAPNGSGGARGAPPTADTTAGTNAEVFARLRELIAGEPEGSPALASLERLPERVLAILGDEKNLRLEMGEMANQILRSINAIALARADLENAAQTLHYSQKLAERGFITANELQRDQLQHQRQLSAQTLGWNDLLLLVDYTLPETLIGLALEIENAELALESVRATNDARRVREAAELRSIEAEHGLAKEQLENWDRQIENGVLKAPAPGLVVYARMDWDEPVYEGMEVRERQEILLLPDVSSMLVELRVPEAQIGRLAAGQPATVQVDALAGRRFAGRVTHVSTLPDPQPGNQQLKVYEAHVAIDGANPEGALRPGMNATVTVDVGTIEDALHVPLPALERRGDVHFVWKMQPEGPVAVPVELGGNNLTHVQVLAGLAEGDRICLVRPPGSELPAEDGAPPPAGNGSAESGAAGAPRQGGARADAKQGSADGGNAPPRSDRGSR